MKDKELSEIIGEDVSVCEENGKDEVTEIDALLSEAVALRAEIKERNEKLKELVANLVKTLDIGEGEKFTDRYFYFEVTVQHRKKLMEKELEEFLGTHGKKLSDFQTQTKITSNRYGRVER